MDEDEPRDPPRSAEPLGRVERTTALAVGVASGGAGAYAVFASANQAGTAILLVLSAIFLLIGVQGTALIRFSSGSNTVELERRKRDVEQAVKMVAKEDPARAAGIIEGAEIAQPNLGSFAQVEETLFARRVELAIVGLGYFIANNFADSGADLIVGDKKNLSFVYVVTKYRDLSPLPTPWVRETASRKHNIPYPLLIVTNVGFRTVATAYVEDAQRESSAKLIQWRDSQDTDVLRDALAELFSSAQAKITGPSNL